MSPLATHLSQIPSNLLRESDLHLGMGTITPEDNLTDSRWLKAVGLIVPVQKPGECAA